MQSFGKTLLDIGITILKFANSDVGQTIIQLTLLVTSLNLVAKGFEALKISTKALGIATLIKDVASLKAGMQTVVSSQLALDIATKGLTKTFIANATAWLTTPMGMATAIAVGVFALIKVVDALTVSFDEQVEKLEEAKSAYESTKTELENITEQLKQVRDRIDEINNKDELSITEENQLRLLKEQEASLEHQLILQQELNKEAKDQATTEAKKTLSKSFESAEAFGVTTDYFQSSMPVTTVGKGTLTEAIDSLNQKMAEEQDTIDSLIAKRNELEVSNQKESAEYNELGAQLDTHIQKRDELRATTAEYVKTMDEAISVADQEDETVKGAISIRDAYDTIVKRIIGTEEEAQNQANKTGDALDDENDEVESLDESLKKLAQSVGLSVEELQVLADTLGVTNEVAAQIQSSWNDWNDTVDDIQSAYQTLASAVEEYNSQGYYTTDTIQSLLALSPEYLGMLQEENGKIVLNEEAIRNKVIAQAEEAKQIAYDTAIKRLNAIASGDTATATEKAGEASSNAASKHSKNAQALTSEAKANLLLAESEARARGGAGAEGEIQGILRDLNEELSAIDKWSESLGTSFEGSMGKATKSTNKTTSALKEQKSALDQLKDKYKDVINFILDGYDKQIDKLEDARDAEIDRIEAEIDALEKERDARKEYWDGQLDALEKNNDTTEDAITLQEKLNALATAQQTKQMIFKDGRFQYSSDEEAVSSAQSDIDEFNREQEYKKQKELLEQLRDTELDNYDKRLEDLESFKEERQRYYEEQIENLKEQKEATKELLENGVKDQKEYEDKMLAQLGNFVADWNATVGAMSFPDISGSGIDVGNISVSQKSSGGSSTKTTKTATVTKPKTTTRPKSTKSKDKNIHVKGGRIMAYASGTNSIKDNEIALVGDNPKYRELVIGSKLNNDQGTLMRLSSGSGVVNADSTKTLASIFNSLSGQINSAPFANNGVNNGTTISIGSISLPEVKDGQGFVDYMQHFSTDITQQSFNRV